MLKRLMHRRERQLALRNDNRVVRPFEWGREFADSRFVCEPNASTPQSFFQCYSQNAVARSDDFFSLSRESICEPENSNQNGEIKLAWNSEIETVSPENNTIRARFFPVENAKRAVLVLPHWNAEADSYVALCKIFNRFKIAALRLSLPYHDERRPTELDRADYLVSPNIGRTLQSIQQAVLDAKSAVKWLKSQGFERVGIVGTSIGSCTAFLAMTHDASIDAGVFNHVSGYVGDVTWRGISTHHVRQSLENNVTLEELREFWLPVSPMAYMKKLSELPPRPMRYIYTLYDLTFPLDLSKDTIAAFDSHNIKHERTALPCGHYTLGKLPWVYLDGWKIVNFLRKNL